MIYARNACTLCILDSPVFFLLRSGVTEAERHSVFTRSSCAHVRPFFYAALRSLAPLYAARFAPGGLKAKAGTGGRRLFQRPQGYSVRINAFHTA
jgi:hypothetical protein